MAVAAHYRVIAELAEEGPLPEPLLEEAGSSLIFLALLGLLAARAGGSPVMSSVVRVSFWGALAMALTAAVGALFGVVA